MPTATRYDFEVLLHRFNVLLTRGTCSLSGTRLTFQVRVGVLRDVGSQSGHRGNLLDSFLW